MDIFELLKNEKFFNPLSSKNKKIYFECITLLIEKEKETPVLYDSEARNYITMYLKNSQYEFQNEKDTDELVGETSEMNVSTIMSYLRGCGWITPREIGRNGDNMTRITTNCRRIMDFLRKMYDKSNEGALSNHIFSMHEILKASFEEDSARAERPYSNILKPLVEHQSELKNELLDLRGNIASIMRVVMEFQDVNSVGKFLMKDEFLDQFFNDYFFIKNNGLIPSQIAFIKNKLREISHGELSRKMIVECTMQLQISEEEAKEKIEAYLSELQYFLTVEYDETMAFIDARINNYYDLANTRMLLVMSDGTNMESALDSFLSAIKTMNEDEKGQALEKVSECMMICSQKYISRKSYEKRNRKKRDDLGIGLTICDMSEQEKERRTRELMNEIRNRFSVENVNQFLENKMFKNNEIELKQQKITTKEEAIMFTASVMYSGINEFPYEVELKDDYVETNIAKISNITIRKK